MKRTIPMMALILSLGSLLNACGDGREESTLNSAVVVPQDALTLHSSGTACSTGNAPRLTFQKMINGRARFILVGQNVSLPTGPCEIKTQFLVKRSFRVRVAETKYDGTSKRTGNNTGKVHFQTSLTTAPIHDSIFKVTPFPENFANTDTTMPAQNWSKCSKVYALPGETIKVKPWLETTGTGSLTAKLNNYQVTLDVEYCQPL